MFYNTATVEETKFYYGSKCKVKIKIILKIWKLDYQFGSENSSPQVLSKCCSCVVNNFYCLLGLVFYLGLGIIFFQAQGFLE